MWNRTYPLAELRFDNSGIAGDILVVDALVNRNAITELDQTLALHDDTLKWLRYKLADEMAGEYGKELTKRQVEIMDDAYNQMAAGNRRQNTLRVDPGLQKRPAFDINRGDP